VNPVEWHQFLSGLIREGPGTIAASAITFIIGVVVCRWWLQGEHMKKIQEWQLKNEHLGDHNHELMGKLGQALQEMGSAKEEARQIAKALDAIEKARQLAESERDEARGVAEGQAERVAALEQAIETLKLQMEQKESHNVLPQEAAEAWSRLEAENSKLAQGNQALENTVEKLRTELAQVRGELAHSAKWLKVFDEEIARLTTAESVGAQ
jgi:chromosome segregation ATPase